MQKSVIGCGRMGAMPISFFHSNIDSNAARATNVINPITNPTVALPASTIVPAQPQVNNYYTSPGYNPNSFLPTAALSPQVITVPSGDGGGGSAPAPDQGSGIPWVPIGIGAGVLLLAGFFLLKK